MKEQGAKREDRARRGLFVATEHLSTRTTRKNLEKEGRVISNQKLRTKTDRGQSRADRQGGIAQAAPLKSPSPTPKAPMIKILIKRRLGIERTITAVAQQGEEGKQKQKLMTGEAKKKREGGSRSKGATEEPEEKRENEGAA